MSEQPYMPMDEAYETAKSIALSDTLCDQLPDPDNDGQYYQAVNFDRLITAIAAALRAYGDERARVVAGAGRRRPRL